MFYFDPKTKSPITLMELGNQSPWNRMGKDIVVCCPDEFWRKGNVDILCDRYGIKVSNNYETFLQDIKQVILEQTS